MPPARSSSRCPARRSGCPPPAASPAAAFGVGLWLDISQVPLRENNPTAAVVERFRRDFPQGIVDAFEAEGFIWGGKWHDYEFGYFEYQGRRID